MENATWLDRLRREFPACRLAAFADLSTGMVLSTSTDMPVAQERLDRLCATAVELLDGESAARVSRATGKQNAGWLSHAMTIDGGEIGVFVRSGKEPRDALCCLCDAAGDLDALIAAAGQCLESVSADQ